MGSDSSDSVEQSKSKQESLRYVMQADDLEEGSRVVIDVDGREIGVFNIDGEFSALANYCVHQGGPLCEGGVSGTIETDEDKELVYTKDGQVISCPWHGWGFDISSGEHVVPSGHKIPTYTVEVIDGDIYLDV